MGLAQAAFAAVQHPASSQGSSSGSTNEGYNDISHQDELALLSAALGALALLGVDKAARDRLLTAPGAVQLLVQIACLEDERCHVHISGKPAVQGEGVAAAAETAGGEAVDAPVLAGAGGKPAGGVEKGANIQGAAVTSVAAAEQSATVATATGGEVAEENVGEAVMSAGDQTPAAQLSNLTAPILGDCVSHSHDPNPGVSWPDTVPPLVNQVSTGLAEWCLLIVIWKEQAQHINVISVHFCLVLQQWLFA